jgi:predicted TIM-barrel fold metal-dependent hydrolase
VTVLPDIVYSSDTHVAEPPDLFVTGVASAFRDEAPRTVTIDGMEWWILDGEAVTPATSSFRVGDRFLPREERPRRTTYAEYTETSGYEPTAWLDALARDGVAGGVVFPSNTMVFYSVRSGALLDEILRVYNAWIAEFASSAPQRIKAIGLLDTEDPRAPQHLAELKAEGFAGVMIPVVPLDGHAYDSDSYEPLWSAAADAGMPIHLHVATDRNPDGIAALRVRMATNVSRADYLVRVALADMIFSGVFERHPTLRVVSVEHEGGWVPFWLDRMDWTYRHNLRFQDGHRLPEGTLPSDYARRNVLVSFTDDPGFVARRDTLGVGAMMWGNDFPHAESTAPYSRELLDGQLGELTTNEVAAITRDNVATLYRFDE